ncbi:MAG: hypothetical protein J6W29_03225 [Neisseriaceae bacterium]|nr:hypothetical protein [Neisseriaceae bacterium]
MVMKATFRKNKNQNPRMFREGVVRVGFFEGSKYDDNTSVAQVARWNEYGTSNAPSRPFMRPAVFEKKQELTALLRSEYKKAFKDKRNTMEVLKKFGEKVVFEIQNQILTGNYVPNAPATIKAKGGRSKPLYDTGLMLNSVSYKAEEVKRL